MPRTPSSEVPIYLKRPLKTTAVVVVSILSHNGPALTPALEVFTLLDHLDDSGAEKGDNRLAEVDVLLNTGFGVRSDQQADIKKLWPKLTGLKWMHCASAGKPAFLFCLVMAPQSMQVEQA